MHKIKLWLARRWLHLVPLRELKHEITSRALDETYKQLAENMIQLYFQAGLEKESKE